MGGLALLLAASGAGVASHALVTNVSDPAPRADQQSTTQADAVAEPLVAAIGDRIDPVISRSGARPRSTNQAASGTSRGKSPSVGTPGSRPNAPRASTSSSAHRTERQADRRETSLKQVATRARLFAEALERQEARRAERARQAAAEAERIASSGWVLPTSNYRISVWFGEAGPYWSSGYHTGIDFATAYGTPVVAVADASVVQVGWDGAYGNQVRIQLENGDQVWYSHLSAFDVSTGQQVAKGAVLGRVGETGNAYGAHLHLEYRLASDLSTGVDPRPYLESHGAPIG
jgi:murein DD-endopeptidase MepM/ murein hydrolase activator NlpD